MFTVKKTCNSNPTEMPSFPVRSASLPALMRWSASSTLRCLGSWKCRQRCEHTPHENRSPYWRCARQNHSSGSDEAALEANVSKGEERRGAQLSLAVEVSATWLRVLTLASCLSLLRARCAGSAPCWHCVSPQPSCVAWKTWRSQEHTNSTLSEIPVLQAPSLWLPLHLSDDRC